jgi:P2-related tail formation protein
MLEYLEIYFDRIYNEIYNLQKNIYSLYDPLEIDERYLHYLSMMYNIDLDQNVLTSSKQREFIRDIIFLLERKGVYNCFHII